MKDIMIRVKTNLQELKSTNEYIVVNIKHFSVKIKPQIKVYLTDGKSIFGYGIIKESTVDNSLTKITLFNFHECNPHLLFEEFNSRTNQQLKKMTQDAISVTRRSEYENNLLHFIEYSDLSTTSIKAYRLDIRQFLIYLLEHEKKIASKLIIKDYQTYLKELGLSVSSIQRKSIAVKRFLYFEDLNSLDQELCITNRKNKKVRIINLDNYEII